MAKILSEDVGTIQLIRKNGKTTLKLKLAPEIEDLFKASVEGQIQKIDNKKGLVYQWYPVTNTTSKFSKWGKRYLLNRPEMGLDYDKTFNFSFLFAKGTGEGIALDFEELYSRELLEEYGKQLNIMLKEVYNEYISDLTLEHSMSLYGVSV